MVGLKAWLCVFCGCLCNTIDPPRSRPPSFSVSTRFHAVYVLAAGSFGCIPIKWPNYSVICFSMCSRTDLVPAMYLMFVSDLGSFVLVRSFPQAPHFICANLQPS